MKPYLRRFTADDWQAFKAIRLETLEKEQHFMGAPLAHEQTFPDQEWMARLSNPDSAIWGLYDGDTCIGLTGVVKDRDNPEVARLIASYIRQEYRNRGLSALFYQARIDWAREKGFKYAEVHHRQDNLASKAANQKFAFEHIGSKMIPWPDGTEDIQVSYRLTL